MKYIYLLIFLLASNTIFGQVNNLEEYFEFKTGTHDKLPSRTFSNFTWPKWATGETIEYSGDITLSNVIFDGVQVTFFQSSGTNGNILIKDNLELRNGACLVFQSQNNQVSIVSQNCNISSGSTLVLKARDVQFFAAGSVSDNSKVFLLGTDALRLNLGAFTGNGFRIGKLERDANDFSRIMVVSDNNLKASGRCLVYGPASYSFESDEFIENAGFIILHHDRMGQDYSKVWRFTCGKEVGVKWAPELPDGPSMIVPSAADPVGYVQSWFGFNQYRNYYQQWQTTPTKYITKYNALALTTCDQKEGNKIAAFINDQAINQEGIEVPPENRISIDHERLRKALKLFPNPGDGTSIGFEADIEFDHAVMVKIFDYTGHLVDEKQVSHLNGKGQFSMPESAPTGMYLIHLFDYYGQIIGYQKYVKE